MATQNTVSSSDLAQCLRAGHSGVRTMIAIAGPPGSGKSTLAENLARQLNSEDPDCAMVLPMDGFHFDDLVLNARGWRPRKGAPHTFDVAGLKAMLERIKANVEPEIAVPLFDREIEIARNGARIIPASVDYVIVEGNYLLLDAPPWTDLAPYFDVTVYLDEPMDVLRARLEERWKDLSPEDRTQKLEANDIPNAELVREHSRDSDYVVRNF